MQLCTSSRSLILELSFCECRSKSLRKSGQCEFSHTGRTILNGAEGGSQLFFCDALSDNKQSLIFRAECFGWKISNVLHRFPQAGMRRVVIATPLAERFPAAPTCGNLNISRHHNRHIQPRRDCCMAFLHPCHFVRVRFGNRGSLLCRV